jgi:type IV pilus assembly protein PilP
MSFKKASRLIPISMVVILAGCGGGDYADLDAFMKQAKSRPKGHIEPIPTFRPYKAFTYGATAMRAPFDKPVKVKEITRIGIATDVEPDENRVKEYLESFNFESLSMVGTLEQDGQLWVLIDDGEGGVHRVQKDNYVGRNHGRIVEANASYIQVVEIVPDGMDGWVERPRSLKLKESD